MVIVRAEGLGCDGGVGKGVSIGGCLVVLSDSDRRNLKHGVINRLSLPVQGPKS